MKEKKIKTTEKQFEFYKKECKKWIDRFELNNWKVWFIKSELEDAFSQIHTKINGYGAKIILNSSLWNDDGISVEQILAETAKHEIIHLLLSRFSDYAKSRDYTNDQLYEAEEEVVRKLENIIA